MQGKRIFVLKANKARTDHKFHLKGLPSSGGRMDIVCRCISRALLYYGDETRRDTVFYAVLLGSPNPPKTIRIDGSRVEGLEANEISIGKMIREALKCYRSNIKKEVLGGVSVTQMSFQDLVVSFAKKGYHLIYLHENGEDIRKTTFSAENTYVFILGDHIGLNDSDKRLLDRLDAVKISVSPKSLLGSHCIAIVHNELDRRFSARSSSL
ncbi:MAG: tRNA (pseudouridine(54)-N(1))-methyltransferase TrmY [Candidatus Baldrarchaeota archaeon]